jgi:hypothetical protein
MSEVTIRKSLYLATILENAGKHEEAMKYMEEIAKSKKNDLSIEEINLLTISFNNQITKKLNQIKILNKVIAKDELTNSKYLKTDTNIRDIIQRDINDICNKMINLCDNYLLNKTEKNETKILYLKLRGQYYRYLSDVLENEQQKDANKNAINSFNEAFELIDNLSVTNPIRLGFILNYAIFQYEFLNDIDTAIKITKENFEIGINQLEKVNDNNEYQNASSILMLLKQNIDMWNNEKEKESQNQNQS